MLLIILKSVALVGACVITWRGINHLFDKLSTKELIHRRRELNRMNGGEVVYDMGSLPA